MTRIRSSCSKVLRMEKIHGAVSIAVFCIISSWCVSYCSGAGDQGGYFLFTPPFGGDRPPQEVTASKRSGAGDSNDIAPISRASVSPAETLWIGSHKINWSPLPIFQKFLDHHEQKQEQKQQRFAQARKFDTEDEQPQTISKTPYNSISDDSFKDRFGLYRNRKRNYKKPIFHNPHHDFSTKMTSGGFFAGLGAAFGRHNTPRVAPPKFAQPRSSIQPEEDYPYSYTPTSSLSQPQRNQPTTPLPHIQSSTGGTMLVSPPGTIAALSTPGPSISPIVDRLRKMTEWSKQSQKSGFLKKEGKPTSTVSTVEEKPQPKKRPRSSPKQYKHNIEAIILSNDDDDFNDSLTVEPNNNKPATSVKSSSKTKRKSRGRNVSKEKNHNDHNVGIEEAVNAHAIQLPKNDLVILNPTNAAYLYDPLEVQQSALKNYQIKRKDKKMGVFISDDLTNRPAPVSFRFGAEDAKVNPYTN